MLTTISSITILLYLIAAGIQAMGLMGKLEKTRIPLLSLGFVAIILHAFLLYHWIDIGPGQNLTFFNVLSQIAWLISLIILFIIFVKPIENLAAIIFPLTAISVLLAAVFPGYHVINTAANPKQLIHILISFLAVSVLCVAATQALLLAVQDRLLRSHQGAAFIESLPPLETMENLLFQMIGIGFILLSFVLVSAFVFFPVMFNQALIQHTLLASVSWIVFAVLLAGRAFFGWRGQFAIRWTMGGVFILLFAYFGSRLLMELLV